MRTRRLVVALALLLAAIPALAGVNRWSTQGPDGGWIQALAMDPSSPNTIYAAAYSAGVFKSVDGSAHWKPSNQGFTYLQGYFWMLSLAVDPQTPSTVYAGSDGAGVYKSTDGGKTWFLRSDDLGGNAGIIQSLVIDPVDPSTLYVSTPDGVFKSTDAGCTWVPKSVGLPGPPIYAQSISIDPTNPSVLYLGTLFNTVYKSVDGADSWFPSGTGLTYQWAGVTAVDPANSSHLLVTDIYFVVDLGFYDGKVMASDDGGGTWHDAGTTLPSAFYHSVVFDPATPGRVYATSDSGIFRSDDGGATWSPSSSGLLDPRVGPLLVGPGLRLLAGTTSLGVVRSDDAGATWAPASPGLSGAQWPNFSASVSNPDVIFAAGSGDPKGIVRSGDGGQTWQSVGTGLNSSVTGITVAVDPTDANIVYASQFAAAPNTFKTTDGGATWSPIENGLLNGDAPGAFAIDPSDTQIVYAGAGANFYHSSDGGGTWTPSTTTLPAAYSIIARGGGLPIFAISASVPYESTDGGDTWNPASNGIGSVWCLAAAPSNSSRLYAGTPDHGVYISTDDGDSWAPVSGDLSAYVMQSITVDATDADHLFVSTRNLAGTPGVGVLESTDAGATWTPLTKGLDPPGFETFAVAFLAGGQTLYLSTFDGIYDYTFASGPSPLPTSVTPFDGPAGGGTAVTIVGAGFVSGATARIGGAPATSVVVVDAATITAVTPAGSAGAQDVVVENPDGQIETLSRGFVYDFDDVPPSSDFHDAVAKLTHAGVTAGCGAGLFCPYDALTRGQAAVFIEKAIHGADTPPPNVPISFDDVLPCSPEGPYILQLAFENITVGCGTDVFCPDSPNTRAQGAVFILKAEHGASYVPPKATGTVFSDVPATAFAADFIEQLATEGVTVGCGSGMFCPDAPLTRGQAAAYITATILPP